MMVKHIVSLLLFILSLSVLPGGEYQTIYGGKEKNVEEGFTFYNKYCQMAFLNPSLHRRSITGGDFSIMLRSDTANQHTLEENEAKLRLFFKPDIVVRSTARRPALIPGEGIWRMEKISDGIKYLRNYVNETHNLQCVLTVIMPPDRAQFNVELTLENTGKRSCAVEFTPQFTFLRNDVEPLHLTLRRQMTRYSGGQRKSFFCNESTELNGKYQSYWWRRAAQDLEFVSYFNRECIPFGHERLVAPDMFGFTGLAGNSVLIWDLAEAGKIKELDVSWEAGHGDAMPIWAMTLGAGEKKQIKFRVLTVKGMIHFDELGSDWIFGYDPRGDLLEILATPLVDNDRISITTTVNDARNQVLVSQRSEVAAMTPFKPGRISLRTSVPFQNYVNYPVKLILHSLLDNSLILEVAGNIVP